MTEKGMSNCVWKGLGSFMGEVGIFVILKVDYFLSPSNILSSNGYGIKNDYTFRL